MSTVAQTLRRSSASFASSAPASSLCAKAAFVEQITKTKQRVVRRNVERRMLIKYLEDGPPGIKRPQADNNILGAAEGRMAGGREPELISSARERLGPSRIQLDRRVKI